MPKSKKKRANPFVEAYGFQVDRVVRSVVPAPVGVIPIQAPGNSAPPFLINGAMSDTDWTKETDEQLDLSVEICSFIAVQED